MRSREGREVSEVEITFFFAAFAFFARHILCFTTARAATTRRSFDSFRIGCYRLGS
jgi:hypothetical protein